MPPPVVFHHATPDRPARVAVIAEVGVNHDGDPATALALTHAAAAAGADAVKFQLFRPERLLSADATLAGYQAGRADSARDLLKKVALDAVALAPLRDAARAAGLAFVVTPFSPADVADLAALDVDAVKIASPDAVNPPLLEAAAGLKRPLWISTGTCAADELDDAARHAAAGDGALLQCASAYPTPDDAAALGGIAALRQRFPGVRIGYSDHTADEDTGALAVAAGACLLEKHLTHDPAAPGPDHAVSLGPAELGRYVAAAHRAAVRLGPIAKACQPIERDVRTVSRQSLCPARDLPAGHRLGPDDLVVKRPGTGVPAAAYRSTLGRTLARAVAADHPLRPEDLAG